MNFKILLIYIIILVVAGQAMVYIWQKSILPAIEQYYEDQRQNINMRGCHESII